MKNDVCNILCHLYRELLVIIGFLLIQPRKEIPEGELICLYIKPIYDNHVSKRDLYKHHAIALKHKMRDIVISELVLPLVMVRQTEES